MGKKIKIMVCVDFSQFTLETIQAAIQLIKKQESEIVLLHVINGRDISAVRNVSAHLPIDYSVENYIKRTKEERHNKIKEIVERHFFEYKDQISPVFRIGIPYRAILKAIETENIDIVAMANKGRSNLMGTLHGSNAEKVFRHSPVPVFSVRNKLNFEKNRSNWS